MIFSFFPPEVNSTLIYTGPGSGPLASAATAWEGLANDLSSVAASFQSIVSNLTSGAWTGPSSQEMAAAVEPFMAWLTNTSAQAAQTGAQAAAAVGAYEAAHAATVPPGLVFANRAQLLMLIATNFFGQNTPAIAANEAQYAEMWVQDSTTMNTYSVASTQATMMPQMVTPVPAASTNGVTQQSPAADFGALGGALQALMRALSGALTGQGVSAVPSAFDTVLADLGISSLSGVGGTESVLLPMQAGYYGLMAASMPARMFMSMGSSMSRGATGAVGAGSSALMNSIGQFVDGKMQAIVGSVANQLRTWGSSVSAQLGRATMLGGLSVPHAWSEAATGAITRAAPIMPNTSIAAPAASAGLPGGPFGHALLGAMSGRGLASLAAKAPKVVPKSPAAG